MFSGNGVASAMPFLRFAGQSVKTRETVVGERDADFNHVSTGGKDTIKSTIGAGVAAFFTFRKKKEGGKHER